MKDGGGGGEGSSLLTAAKETILTQAVYVMLMQERGILTLF